MVSVVVGQVVQDKSIVSEFCVDPIAVLTVPVKTSVYV